MTIGKNAAGGAAGAAISQIPELISRAVLCTIADAWRRYPSEVPLRRPDELKLFEQVLGLLAQEGLVQLTGSSLALTTTGHEALQQVSRTDHRFSEILQSGAPSLEHPVSSSLVLAILQAHFRLRNRPSGNDSR